MRDGLGVGAAWWMVRPRRKGHDLLSVGTLILLGLAFGPRAAEAQACGPSVAPEAGTAPFGPRRRLVAIVPRVGAQLGAWGSELSITAEAGPFRATQRDDASRGAGVVGGAEVLFRIGSTMRLGAGVLVMPGVRVHVDPKDSELPSYNLTLGTIVRVPGVFEWAFPLTGQVDLVVGAIPSLGFLVRGEQAERFAKNTCDSCAEGPSVALSADGELGTIVHIGGIGLRTDVRYGLEIVSIASDTKGGDSIDVSLIGTRLLVLAGVEL